MDPRIKQLKCIACKVSVSAHHREAVDLMLTSCERNNTHVQSRLGRCPFRQMVETLDADYEKEKRPKKQEIPRLLDMRHAQKQACNDNPFAESNCPEAGPHCQHGACGPCLEGEVEGPVQARRHHLHVHNEERAGYRVADWNPCYQVTLQCIPAALNVPAAMPSQCTMMGMVTASLVIITDHLMR
jgi:hypothetical protein